MQFFIVSVMLAGDRNHIVSNKGPVSVAEIAILRAIHGADSIQDIRRSAEPGVDPQTGRTFSTASLREYLRSDYQNANPAGQDNLVDKLFGPMGALPTQLEDIGLSAADEAKKLRAAAQAAIASAELLETEVTVNLGDDADLDALLDDPTPSTPVKPVRKA